MQSFTKLNHSQIQTSPTQLDNCQPVSGSVIALLLSLLKEALEPAIIFAKYAIKGYSDMDEAVKNEPAKNYDMSNLPQDSLGRGSQSNDGIQLQGLYNLQEETAATKISNQ